MKNYLKPLAVLFAAATLSACADGTEYSEPEQTPYYAQSNIEVLSTYRINNDRFVEYRTQSNPDDLYIAVDGTEAYAVEIVEDALASRYGGQGQSNDVLIFQYYELPNAGTSVDFRPANAHDAVCTYIDGVSSGSLVCAKP